MLFIERGWGDTMKCGEAAEKRETVYYRNLSGFVRMDKVRG